MTSKKRSRLSDSLSDDCVEGVDHPTPIKKQRQYLGKRSRLNGNCVEAIEEEFDHPTPTTKKQRQYLGSDLFNQMLLDELVIKIFSYFEYKDLLLGAALVCKRWENLSWDSDLWQSLDLSRLPCRFNITTRTVGKLLNRSKGIKHINLKECRFIEDSIISNIVEQKELRTLVLDDCRRLSGIWIGSIANCRSLEHLDLRRVRLSDDSLALIAKSCTNLIKLNISGCYNVTTEGLLPVIQHCTQLKCLGMYCCMKVNDDFLIALAAIPSQIESLDISFCTFTTGGLKYLGKLPNLTRINVAQVENMCNNLLSIFSNLTFLNLYGVKDINNDGVSTIVLNNPNLENLDLSWCTSVDNIALEIISESSCRFTLTHLVIAKCSTTEDGINFILRNCVKLRTLTFPRIPEETVKKWMIDYPQIYICSMDPGKATNFTLFRQA